MSAINLTIDGKEISVAPGTTILEAARQLGIDIPTFCYDPDLAPNGACRICVVEVEKARALVASCVAPAGPGMVVHTESERVVKARKAILSLQLANHPLDCIVCEKTGNCKLQDYCYRYNVTTSDFVGEVKDLPYDDTNEFFLRDMNKCILCGICVGRCQEIVGAGAIDFTKRGFVTNVAPAFEDSIEESTCVYCGMCIDNCPVGALVPKYSFGQGRPWQTEQTEAVCPYCSLGCKLNLHVKDNTLIGVTPANESPVNKGQLCAKGKFGWDYVQSSERLTAPLIKSDGVFIEVSWEEALDYIVDNIKDVQERFCQDALMGLGSPKSGNEDSYLFQRLIRSLGSNNVDSYTRHCHGHAVDSMMDSIGSAGMTNSIAELTGTNAILVIGTDPSESHPIIDFRIREAVAGGTSLTVSSPVYIPLVEAADIFLDLNAGTELALVNGIINVVINEELTDKDFIKKRTEGFDDLKKSVSKYTPEYVSSLTGLSVEAIVNTARNYASAEKAAIVSSGSIGNDLGGKELVTSLLNLSMLTGNLGSESTGIYLPYDENNLQGSADMGILPGMLTGYQPVSDKNVREKFEKKWNVKLSDKEGISVIDLLESGAKKVRAMYIMGENPVACEGESGDMIDVLNNLDFLVVQDMFMTETASLADVVLPAASFAEKVSTYTNTERRVQLSEPALDLPGDAFPDWVIIYELADYFGFAWEYEGPENIFAEIAELTPDYAGISYKRLEDNNGLQWPCPDSKHEGTTFLHAESFSSGKGKFIPVDYKEPVKGFKMQDNDCCSVPHQGCHCQSDSLSKRSVIRHLKHNESCCR